MFMHSNSHDSEMVVHAVGADMNFVRLYEATDILAEKKKTGVMIEILLWHIMSHSLHQHQGEKEMGKISIWAKLSLYMLTQQMSYSYSGSLHPLKPDPSKETARTYIFWKLRCLPTKPLLFLIHSFFISYLIQLFISVISSLNEVSAFPLCSPGLQK